MEDYEIYKKIKYAFTGSHMKMRNIEGISKDSELSTEDVNNFINNNSDLFNVHNLGQTLYSLKNS